MRVRDMLRSLVGRSELGLQGLALGLLLFSSACQRDDESRRSTTYYNRKIGVTLTQSCATSPTKSGCHVAPTITATRSAT